MTIALAAALIAVAVEKAPIDTFSLTQQLLAGTTAAESNGFWTDRWPEEWSVSYCPDQTCDVIRAPGTTSSKTMSDFALIYLYYVSDYAYLKDFVLRARPHVLKALERNNGNCRRSSEFARAACVLSTVARKNGMKFRLQRYDEGRMNETELEPGDHLGEKHIREVKSWQSKTWGLNVE